MLITRGKLHYIQDGAAIGYRGAASTMNTANKVGSQKVTTPPARAGVFAAAGLHIESSDLRFCILAYAEGH